MSLEFLADKTDNPRAGVLGEALDRATGKLLEEGRSPSRKAGELDNRGSHAYLAIYWAAELAGQTDDAELAEAVAPLAERLAADEEHDRRGAERASRASPSTSAATSARTPTPSPPRCAPARR